MTPEDARQEAARPPIFLGGTTGRNDWRRGFVARLVERGLERDAFFDPEPLEGHARKVLEQSEVLFRRQDPSVPIFRELREAEDWIAERFFPAGRDSVSSHGGKR